MTFHGPTRADRETYEHAHESPPVMLVPLASLALGAVARRRRRSSTFFIGEGTRRSGARRSFEGADNHILHAMHEVPDWVGWAPTIAMAAGFAARLISTTSPAPALPALTARVFRPLYLFLLNKWYFDELYDCDLRAAGVLARQLPVEGRRRHHHQRHRPTASRPACSRDAARRAAADRLRLSLRLRHADRPGAAHQLLHVHGRGDARWTSPPRRCCRSSCSCRWSARVIIGFLNPEAKDNARWVALWTTIVTFVVVAVHLVRLRHDGRRLPVRGGDAAGSTAHAVQARRRRHLGAVRDPDRRS